MENGKPTAQVKGKHLHDHPVPPATADASTRLCSPFLELDPALPYHYRLGSKPLTCVP